MVRERGMTLLFMKAFLEILSKWLQEGYGIVAEVAVDIDKKI